MLHAGMSIGRFLFLFFLNRNVLFSLTRGERAVRLPMDSKSTIGSDARATVFVS